MPTHHGRREPHAEIAVEEEKHGFVFFRQAGMLSLPRALFDQSYVAIESDMVETDEAEIVIREEDALAQEIARCDAMAKMLSKGRTRSEWEARAEAFRVIAERLGIGEARG